MCTDVQQNNFSPFFSRADSASFDYRFGLKVGVRTLSRCLFGYTLDDHSCQCIPKTRRFYSLTRLDEIEFVCARICVKNSDAAFFFGACFNFQFQFWYLDTHKYMWEIEII